MNSFNTAFISLSLLGLLILGGVFITPYITKGLGFPIFALVSLSFLAGITIGNVFKY